MYREATMNRYFFFLFFFFFFACLPPCNTLLSTNKFALTHFDFNANAILPELRKICNHPFMFDDVAVL